VGLVDVLLVGRSVVTRPKSHGRFASAEVSTAMRGWLNHPWRVLLLTFATVCLAAVPCTYYYACQRMAAIEYVRSTDYSEVKFAPQPQWVPKDFEIPEWMRSVVSVEIRNNAEPDLGRISAIRELEFLSTSGTITDDGIQPIRRFSRLKIAYFSWPRGITDRGLAALENCRQLQVLEIRSSQITDQGLRALAELPLTELELSGSVRLTDACFLELAKISTLRKLFLSRTQVTGKGMRSLARLPLEVLILERTRLTDEGLSEAAEIPRLETLIVNDNRITDAGLAALAQHPLDYIGLSNTYVTPEGVRALCRSTTIKRLDVNVPPFTDADLYDLRALEMRVNGSR
jgi:hypothetical protein